MDHEQHGEQSDQKRLPAQRRAAQPAQEPVRPRRLLDAKQRSERPGYGEDHRGRQRRYGKPSSREARVDHQAAEKATDGRGKQNQEDLGRDVGRSIHGYITP